MKTHKFLQQTASETGYKDQMVIQFRSEKAALEVAMNIISMVQQGIGEDPEELDPPQFTIHGELK